MNGDIENTYLHIVDKSLLALARLKETLAAAFEMKAETLENAAAMLHIETGAIVELVEILKKNK